MVVVVLPTPPFWLHIAMIRAGPCWRSGAGSGNTRTGRPVGPYLTPAFRGAVPPSIWDSASGPAGAGSSPGSAV